MSTRYVVLWAAFVYGFALLVGGVDDHGDALAQHENYCSMVERFEQSNGEAGWPPYKGEQSC